MDMDQAPRLNPEQLLKRYQRSWIAGSDWSDNTGAMASFNPADGSALGEVETVSEAGVNAAVASSRRAFAAWGRLPALERSRILEQVAAAIAGRVNELALLETLEVGRPLLDATQLNAQAPGILRRYIGMADGVRGDVVTADERQLGLSWRRPRGVVGAILPWNFPVMNVMVRLAPALAAGNTVVVKPSEHAPRAALALAQIATEAGLPEGVFNVVLGDGPVAGQALAAHPDVDLVTFTGSTATGLAISRAAATTTLKPVLLECGGKSPQIVLDDCFDDPGIWQPVFFSSFWNSGQWCAAKTRLLVPRARLEQALDGLQGAAAAWAVGDPMAAETRLGPLVNTAQQDRVLEYFDVARREGTVVELDCPRDTMTEKGCYVAPAVALEQPRGSRVTREEVFGPLLTVEAFDGIDDAIALANASDYGLMASIWTNRMDIGYRMARQITAGGLTITSSAEAAMASVPDIAGACLEPQKQSGYGPDGGSQGLWAYTTSQSLTLAS